MKVNQSCEKIFGYKAAELIGKSAKIWRSDYHDPEFYESMSSAIHDKGRWQGEVWDRHKDGSLIPILASLSTIYDEDGKVDKRIATLIDITKEKSAQEHISKLAHFDTLTELPNRKLSTDRLQHAINIAKRRGTSVSVFFIDLDDFKRVNDTYGHHIGDELLCQVSERLLSSTRDSDTVGRLSGDEFVIIIEDVNGPCNIKKTVDQIFSAFTNPVCLAFGDYYVSLSIGVATYPEDGETVIELLKNADMAMYSAKKSGKNKGHFYTRFLSEEMEGQVQLHNDLRDACQNSELELYYQPILETESQKVVGAEALCRWQHHEKGWIVPSYFIPIAEASDLIHDIGDWVLETACRQYVLWQNEGITLEFISVNVSGVQIMKEGFSATVQKILQDTQCPAQAICLELTESFVMKDSEDALGKIQALQQTGVRLAIDDFGTGY